MKTKYIGVSGVARVGKNLFCDISSDILKEEYGLKSETFALATYLKRDCEDFLKTKLGLNVWSEDTDEKTIFRPFLIWYGGVKRKWSKGRCWIEMSNADLLASKADVCFVSDVRYATYANDEAYWIQTELSGKLIHLSKHKIEDGVACYTPPASEDEAKNDPMIRLIADYNVDWKHSDLGTYDLARHSESLRGEVRKALTAVM